MSARSAAKNSVEVVVSCLGQSEDVQPLCLKALLASLKWQGTRLLCSDTFEVDQRHLEAISARLRTTEHTAANAIQTSLDQIARPKVTPNEAEAAKATLVGSLP